MKNHRNVPWQPRPRDVYERLAKRLDDVAEREGRFSNSERIELLGRFMFGDLWDEAAPAASNNSVERNAS